MVVLVEPPPSFFAVMVYGVAAISDRAVPEILPVVGSSDKPAGSTGVMVKSK